MIHILHNKILQISPSQVLCPNSLFKGEIKNKMSQSNNPKAHALVFPYPYLGHITPAFNLAEKLASNGFAVTFVLPEFLRDCWSGGGAAVRFATIFDGFSDEFDRDLNFDEYWESMIADFPARVDDFVASVRKSDEADTELFLIADTLYTWPTDIATKHGLMNVSFWTESALVLNIGYHSDLLEQNGHSPYKGIASSSTPNPYFIKQ